jgi:glycosyltransferase involved in cell wall biosynthesis
VSIRRGEATAVFAGGNSLRDYRALAAVAPTLDAPVVIATRLLQSSHDGNVRIGQLPQADYDRELRAARVVVVPLRDDTTRSAGQQTFLSAMALGKPVVVTDSPGVRDYVRDGETGLIVPPNDPQRLAEALRWLLDDANRADVEAMTARARRDVAGNYSLAAYLDRVLDVVQTVLS